MNIRDEVTTTVSVMKADAEGTVDRIGVINFLATAGKDRGVVARTIGQLVRSGALIQTAGGRLRLRTDSDPAPVKVKRKKRAPKVEVEEPTISGFELYTVEQFCPALTPDGRLLLLGVMGDGIVELSAEQVEKLRQLLTRRDAVHIGPAPGTYRFPVDLPSDIPRN